MGNMLKVMAFAIVPSLLLMPGPAEATRWGDASHPDPIKAGAKCTVAEVLSSGSYIYQWPSKYDQVFWPLIDPKAIWFCPKSGFTSFVGDFDSLSSEEKASLAKYLAASYKQGKAQPTLAERLRWLEGCYALRSKDDAFRNRLLRVLAYFYENDLNDQKTAAAYRRKALDQIQEMLKTNLKEEARLEYLFVVAAYEKELGDAEKSDAALKFLTGALANSTNKGLAEYFKELVKEIPRITPGGKLQPDEAKD